MRAPFPVAQMLRQTAANAIPEWISRSEHHRRTATASEYAAQVERYRPDTAAFTDPGQRQMTLTAEHGLGCGDRLSACLRQPVKAILPDADNGEPRIGLRLEQRVNHDARPHPGRNERGQSSR